MCHDLFSFLIAIVFSECLKIKKDALNLFPSSKRHCFMSCSIHGYSGLSIPDLKKNKKIFRICMEINITLLKKMGYYVATAAEAFLAYGIPTRYVEGYYLSGDYIHREASGINKLTGAGE